MADQHESNADAINQSLVLLKKAGFDEPALETIRPHLATAKNPKRLELALAELKKTPLLPTDANLQAIFTHQDPF